MDTYREADREREERERKRESEAAPPAVTAEGLKGNDRRECDREWTGRVPRV